MRLEHLAEYTERLTEFFARYGTRGTWYAHASVGCLHVRPVLNMKSDVDVRKLRAIAEEAFSRVRLFKSSHSGEHGTVWSAANFTLFEEFIAREHTAGRLKLPLRALPERRALLHGHCHQKAFGTMPAVLRTLALIPDLRVETVSGTCGGMAGAFGYQARHFDVSMAMAETSLLPAVRALSPDALLVADGFSCQHQIAGGTRRRALHVAGVLDAASR